MKSVFKRFKILIIAYLSFILLWLLAKLFQPQLTPIIETEKGIDLGAGFYTSWLASLSEDILFFGVIGFLGLILSTKLPQDEEFNIRIDSIANGRKVGDKARRFLNQSIKELLRYNDSAYIKIIIKSIDQQSKLAEVYAEFYNVCANMCKDVVFPLNANACVIPTHNLNGDYGYISYLGIYEEGNTSNKNILYDGDIYKLPHNGFTKTTFFDVPANGTAVWRFCYSIWQSLNGDPAKEDDWYFIMTSGFSENFNIQLINRSGQDISYDFKYTDRTSQVHTQKAITDKSIKSSIPTKEVIENLIQNQQAYNNDKFELFLRLKTT